MLLVQWKQALAIFTKDTNIFKYKFKQYKVYWRNNKHIMSFYRSESLARYRLLLPQQNARNIMNQLGKRNLVHIVPNPDNLLSVRPYNQQSKRCSEALNRIIAIENILNSRYNYQFLTEYEKEEFDSLFDFWEQERRRKGKNEIIDFEEKLQESSFIWNKYNELNNKNVEYEKKVLDFRENLAIVRGSEKKFGVSFFENHQKKMQNSEGLSNGYQINFKAGVIKKEQQSIFRRTVVRITKGNSATTFISFGQIYSQLYDEQIDKIVYFILFPGKKGSSIDSKLDKLVTNYSTPAKNLPDLKPSPEQYKQYQDSYLELESISQITQKQFQKFLKSLMLETVYEPAPILLNEEEQKTISSHKLNKLEYLHLFFLKQKQIYNQMNEFTLNYGYLSAQIFVRSDDIPKLHQSFAEIQKDHAPAHLLHLGQTHKIPSIFPLNDYTSPAYQIVSTYGTPRYKQANPAFFTTVTFPFLFGVMFGDVGHGSIVLGLGIFLMLKGQSNNSALKMLLPYRYLISLMGLFATYCGFIYNDYLSMSLNLFGSCFDINNAQPNSPIKKLSEDCVYLFGMDPAWRLAQNNLNYMNSLKMKISVIIAVVHMTLGVFIKASNSIYFRKWIDFFFEFVPQAIFLILLFGYMDYLIIFKWLKQWELYDSQAPSIITTMINLPLKMGQTQNCCGGQPMWGEVEQTSQDLIQIAFLLISVLCIPLMLFPKPIYQIVCHKKKKSSAPQRQIEQNDNMIQEQNEELDHATEEEDSQASQIFVHQLIETIQYVLGCISNTASYLRLWALSLAHSQLSQVFFNKTIESGIVSNMIGIPQMVIGFPIFAGITFGVLLCMDTMECFLHTLRLHWVEFQNKFYKGDGYAWNQFNFHQSIQGGLSKREKSI